MLPEMMNEMPLKSQKKKSMPSSQLFDDKSKRFVSNLFSKKGGGWYRNIVKSKLKMIK